MRITVIGPVYPYRGGIAHYTAQLTLALRETGHRVRLISFRRQYPAWLYPGATDKDPSQQPLRVDAEYLLDSLSPWTWLTATQTILQDKPDLVAINWWTTFWGLPYAVISLLLRRKGIKVIYIIHNVLPHEQRFYDASLAKLALSQGRAFIAQTDREKERLLALLPASRIKVCPLPVYMMLVDKRIPRSQARARLGLPESASVFLFFGIVRPYKGLRYLIEALGNLDQMGQKPILLVAGEIWEDKDEYLKIIERLGLQNQVRLEDRYIPDEELPVFFSAADALVAPYINGTQSAAAGMALGFGLPMVVTDIVAAGIADENRQDVLVVPPRDSFQLASALRSFLDSPSLHDGQVSPAEPDWWRLIQTLEELRVER